MDADGNTVKTIEAEALSGRQDVVWDGTDNNGEPVEVGTYQVRIDSVNSAGTTLNSEILVSGIVRGVESQDGVPLLLIGERAVPIGNLVNVAIPTNSEDAADTSDETDTEETVSEDSTGEDSA